MTYDEALSWTQEVFEAGFKGKMCRWKYDGGKLTRIQNNQD